MWHFSCKIASQRLVEGLHCDSPSRSKRSRIKAMWLSKFEWYSVSKLLCHWIGWMWIKRVNPMLTIVIFLISPLAGIWASGYLRVSWHVCSRLCCTRPFEEAQSIRHVPLVFFKESVSYASVQYNYDMKHPLLDPLTHACWLLVNRSCAHLPSIFLHPME